MIEPGESYELVTGKWEGEIATFHTCEPCTNLRDAIADYHGGCFQYGGLFDGAYLDYLEVRRHDRDEVLALHDRARQAHRNGRALI